MSLHPNTSSESSSEEQSVSKSSKGKVPAKQNKTTKGNASTATKTARLGKKRKTDTSLNANEMEELTT